MAEKFELFRLSLLIRPHRDMFAGPDVTREEYLRDVFSREIIYEHNDEKFHYVPMLESKNADVIAGRLGRRIYIEENMPPAEGLTETTRETWKASLIVIDPTEHTDGQKAAIELDRTVASPGTILFALLRAINRGNPASMYTIEAAPIVQTESFWIFAAHNKGKITEVQFDFVVPNMFGGSDSIVEELRAFREKEKARRVTIALKSREGLDVETERTREAVDYVEKAGGTIRARAKKGRTYNSTDQSRLGNIPEPDTGKEDVFVRISRFAKQILGRE